MSATLRAVVVVEARLLARHPREHPDVDLVVVVEQLVAAPLAVDDDERAARDRAWRRCGSRASRAPPRRARPCPRAAPTCARRARPRTGRRRSVRTMSLSCAGSSIRRDSGFSIVRWCRSTRRISYPDVRGAGGDATRTQHGPDCQGPRQSRTGASMSDRIVIVGGGVAAARVSRSYREAGGDGRVTMLSAEASLPYNRPPLSKGLLRGTVEPEAVLVEPAAAYAELEIDVRLEAPVAAVDPSAGKVVLADGEERRLRPARARNRVDPTAARHPRRGARRRLLLPHPRRRARASASAAAHGRPGAHRRRRLHRDGDRRLAAEHRPRGDA